MSNKEDFIRQVQAQLPPNLEAMSSEVPEIVAILAEASLINYDYPRLDVKKVIQILPRFFVHREGKDKSIVSEGKLSAHALLTADYLADSLMPKIKAIRKARFGSEEAPFKSVEEARRWDAKAVEELVAQLKSRDPSHVDGDAKTYLSLVKDRTELAKIGISPASLNYYILADIRPLRMPYEIKMAGRGLTRGRRKCWYVDIRVNAELGLDDLLEIQGIVKEALGTKKGKRLNEKHLQLYTMVRERGGPPSGKGAVKFWQSLLQEWNDTHEGEYQEWRCIKRSYDRLYDRLNAQYETKEVQNEE